LKGCTQLSWPSEFVNQPQMPREDMVVTIKAGLLAPPPAQRPSHLVRTKQWHSRLRRSHFSVRKGEVTAAGPLPNLTGFPI